MAVPANVLKYLKDRGLKSALRAEFLPHRVVFTAYDLAQTLHLPLKSIAKTLLVKTDTDYALAVVPADKYLDIKRLKAALGTKKISIANEKQMAARCKVKPGAITPFGSLYTLPVVIDKQLINQSTVFVGSGDFQTSIKLSPAAMIKSEQAIVATISQNPPTPYKLQKPAKAKPKRKSSGKKRPVKKQARKRR